MNNKNNTWLVILMIAFLSITGCRGFKPPKVNPSDYKLGSTYDANFDQVWEALLDVASESLFSIKHAEKDSGILVAEFSGSPQDLIDCGIYSNGWREWPAIGNDENPPSRLSGVMNIRVKPVGNRTSLTVRARYIGINPAGLEWTFDSASVATMETNGYKVTCAPTYKLEGNFISEVSKRIVNNRQRTK